MSSFLPPLYTSRAAPAQFSRKSPASHAKDSRALAPAVEATAPVRSVRSPQQDSSVVQGGSASDAPRGAVDSVQISDEARQIQKLSQRDREVRSHEAAHASAGGALTGPPSFAYEQGPDGRQYAVAGEVHIDLSPAASPEKTLAKAEKIRSAALAPAQPSSKDLSVAARAASMEAAARMEIQKKEAREPVEPEMPGESQQIDEEPAGVEGREMSFAERSTRAHTQIRQRIEKALKVFERFDGRKLDATPRFRMAV